METRKNVEESLAQNAVENADEKKIELIPGNYYWFNNGNIIYYGLYEGVEDKFVRGNFVLCKILNVNTKEKSLTEWSVNINNIFINKEDCVNYAINQVKDKLFDEGEEITIIIDTIE